MKIDIIETHIEADARELRESQTLAGNLTALVPVLLSTNGSRADSNK